MISFTMTGFTHYYWLYAPKRKAVTLWCCTAGTIEGIPAIGGSTGW